MTSIGVRVPDELLEKLDRLADEEGLDRSTVIRQLLERGYRDYLVDQATDRYRRGEVTMSEAADLAGLTVWEMERALVGDGYTASYTIGDLDREAERLRTQREG